MNAWFVTRRIALTLLAGLAVGVAATGAAAAAPASLVVSPGTVVRGGSVHVSGTCDPNTSGFAISTAFLHDATHDFAGVGAADFSSNAAGAFAVDAQIPASTAPGTYTVTGRCGGGNLGIEATFVVTSAGGVPTGVPAGSGGHATATGADTPNNELRLGGIGLLLVAGGAIGLGRLRAARR
ncbi:MAG: hypothetical protein QOE58_496 [Actinomycetota bacterium]|nr:hypothetical protein [Actinomycetota bacterium]